MRPMTHTTMHTYDVAFHDGTTAVVSAHRAIIDDGSGSLKFALSPGGWSQLYVPGTWLKVVRRVGADEAGVEDERVPAAPPTCGRVRRGATGRSPRLTPPPARPSRPPGAPATGARSTVIDGATRCRPGRPIHASSRQAQHTQRPAIGNRPPMPPSPRPSTPSPARRAEAGGPAQRRRAPRPSTTSPTQSRPWKPPARRWRPVSGRRGPTSMSPGRGPPTWPL